MFYIIFFNFLFANYFCIQDNDNRDINRQEYIFPEQIQSENFVIHFTTASDDFQEINGQLYSLQSNYGYAQSIIDLAEYSLGIYLENGWEDLPPDCDESITDLNSPDHCINFGGNSLYDIYISNDGPGMVVPENSYPVPPYTGGRTSYMKITTLSNNYESLPSWSHHVVAHEVHHSVQLRYGVGSSGSPGNYIYNLWFFEQTASYMENVVFPNSIHLYTMLANCDVVTPLTYTNHGVDYPAEIYPYRSALWQKYLVESLGDSSIVRYMWEDYGLQFATGEPVSLLPIYENSINIATDSQYPMTNAFNEYALWRYFTGSRSVSNTFFEESSGYCTSSTFNEEGVYSLWSNRGGAYFINIPEGGTSLTISSESIDDFNATLLSINPNNEIDKTNLNLINNDNDFNIGASEETQILILNTNYNNVISEQIDFSIYFNQFSPDCEVDEFQCNDGTCVPQSYVCNGWDDCTNGSDEINCDSECLSGDINTDEAVDILDVVLLINLVLHQDDFTDCEDINSDGELNILDIVSLINIILY